MSEMVERVARAIALARGMDPGGNSVTAFQGAPRDCRVWETLVPSARAAIEAMREPTEAMLKAAHQQAYEVVAEEIGDADPALVFVDEEENARTVTRYHRAMIDAALKE